MVEIQMARAGSAATQHQLHHRVQSRVRHRAGQGVRGLQRRDGDGVIEDRGDIVQTVIIVGLFAAAAIIIVGILVAKATQAANSVKTQ